MGRGITSHRARAIAWARSVVDDPRAVYIDTETTGLDTSSEIVDIAVVRGDGEVLLNSLVKPVRPIPIEASRIHGIYIDDVRDAPAWPEVSSLLADMLNGARVIVYNAEYDSKIINACCQRSGRDRLASGWECAMLQYAAYVGQPGQYGGFRWHRLEKAAAAVGIEPGSHRALEDAIACRGVVLAMAEAGLEPPDLPGRES